MRSDQPMRLSLGVELEIFVQVVEPPALDPAAQHIQGGAHLVRYLWPLLDTLGGYFEGAAGLERGQMSICLRSSSAASSLVRSVSAVSQSMQFHSCLSSRSVISVAGLGWSIMA